MRVMGSVRYGTRSAFRLVMATIAVGALAGCEGPGEEGELGNDRFFYACVDATDPACDDLDPLADPASPDLIPAVATGSEFALSTSDERSEPVSPTNRLSVVEDGVDRRTFRAEEAGDVVVVAEIAAGEATDLMHLKVRDPAGASLFVEDAFGAWAEAAANLSMSVGERRELRVALVSADGLLISGAVPIAWSFDPPSFADVASIAGNVVSLTPSAGGDATVRADYANGISTTLAIAVTDGGAP
jgi:hypothetical protein